MTDLAARLTHAAARLEALFIDGSPAVLRAAEIGELFSVEEVFAWIQAVHPRERASTAAAKIRAVKRSWGLDVEEPVELPAPDPGRPAEIYKDGAMILEPAPFLPGPEHGSYAEWARSTHAALGGAFGMQAPGLEGASFEALARLQALFAPILGHTGPRTYRYNAFVGDYPRTPFGFHVDPHQELVFQVALTGRRRGLFWEGLVLNEDDAAWVEDANGRVAPQREPDWVVELEPGDVVFWPGTHVHGFESLDAGEPIMGLSLVIDRASPRSRAEVVRALEVETLGGAATLPVPDERAYVAPGMTLRRLGAFPIAHALWEDALIVGVCGRTLDWPDRESREPVLGLFAALNQLALGASVEVDALCSAHAHEALGPGEIVEVLTVLGNLGFLVEA
ncbi:cupin family protein [Plesiocystis pacifica SIR-1]|uniref:Cupin family protein n=1 Tax=Plesiocystis pacifica SIR-1 TaxID=391625 RepID=A6GJF3_9BACT|nr:hypothetical protein [Plesiocystis pacifica]EDM73993.1 cupin family protein [Plesiocystis pacifica SIR-1]